jgi:cell division initiation protein
LRNNYFIRCRALIRGQEELLAAMENDQREEIPQTVRPAAPGINPVGKVIA